MAVFNTGKIAETEAVALLGVTGSAAIAPQKPPFADAVATFNRRLSSQASWFGLAPPLLE